MFELNPTAEGLRFPTTAQIEKIIQDIDTDSEVRADESKYNLVDKYFNRESLRTTEIEMYALENPFDHGMTYFHTLGTEPRTIAQGENVSVRKTTWRGAHFKEAAHWGENEILELAALDSKFKRVRIQDAVGKAVAGMRLRRKRREEWLAAQVLTTGGIDVARNLPDNPEGVSYKVDYMLNNPTVSLANKFDAKDGSDVSLTNPIEFFRNLMDTDRKGDYPQYVLKEVLTTSHFLSVIRGNTLFWDTWAQYNNLWAENIQERTPTWMYGDDFVLNALRAMLPGITFTFNDTGYFEADGTFKQFIADGHATLIYGDTKVGRFTYTAHAHSDNGTLRIGTGPYAYVEDGLKKPNPYYSIFAGFHGLPRINDYDPRTFNSHRLRFLNYSA